MKIFVKTLPVEDIIKDLSRNFEVPIKKDAGEQVIKIPEMIGHGFIRGTSFSSGIGIIEYKCTFYKDVEICFSVNKVHPLKFIFCSEGRINHSFEGTSEIHTINTYQNIIVSSSGHDGHVLHFTANQTAHVSSLEIIREEFNARQNYDYPGLDDRLKELFKDSVSKKSFFYQGNYSMKSADIVEDINNKQTSGFLRSIFLEGKAYEMMAKQISQFQDDHDEDRLPQILRRSDVEKIKRAVAVIREDLSRNYSVDELAKEVGTNVNKLQEGFKYMFGLTVNKYMQQAKLEAAKDLLINSDKNISQIVTHIGLNNRSYFSKIFKEKFGVSPKYFLKSDQAVEREDK